jgi:hypothetical protein
MKLRDIFRAEVVTAQDEAIRAGREVPLTTDNASDVPRSKKNITTAPY